MACPRLEPWCPEAQSNDCAQVSAMSSTRSPQRSFLGLASWQRSFFRNGCLPPGLFTSGPRVFDRAKALERSASALFDPT
jgi:hypothetical protein